MRDPDTLCQNLEPEFSYILQHVQQCKPSKRPDYWLVRSNLVSIQQRHGFKLEFEWIKPIPQNDEEMGTKTRTIVEQEVKHTHLDPLKIQVKQSLNRERSGSLLTPKNDPRLPHSATIRRKVVKRKKGSSISPAKRPKCDYSTDEYEEQAPDERLRVLEYKDNNLKRLPLSSSVQVDL